MRLLVVHCAAIMFEEMVEALCGMGINGGALIFDEE